MLEGPVSSSVSLQGVPPAPPLLHPNPRPRCLHRRRAWSGKILRRAGNESPEFT